MFLVSSCSCLCPIQRSQVSSREWRCSWSSADRRCSNYIWVIDNFIAYWGVSYIRELTVLFSLQNAQLVEGFGDKEVVRLAAHPEGKHYMALTSDGEVFSWGNGDGGRLGHGNNKWVYIWHSEIFNSLKPSDTIWWHRSGWTLDQAMPALGHNYLPLCMQFSSWLNCIFLYWVC